MILEHVAKLFSINSMISLPVLERDIKHFSKSIACTTPFSYVTPKGYHTENEFGFVSYYASEDSFVELPLYDLSFKLKFIWKLPIRIKIYPNPYSLCEISEGDGLDTQHAIKLFG